MLVQYEGCFPRALLSKLRGVLQGAGFFPRALFSKMRGVLQDEGCFPRAQGCFLPSTFSQCEGRFGIRGCSACWCHAPDHVSPMRGVLLSGVLPRRRESSLFPCATQLAVSGAELTILGSLYQLTPYRYTCAVTRFSLHYEQAPGSIGWHRNSATSKGRNTQWVGLSLLQSLFSSSCGSLASTTSSSASAP